jgi:hypothetical protein
VPTSAGEVTVHVVCLSSTNPGSGEPQQPLRIRNRLPRYSRAGDKKFIKKDVFGLMHNAPTRESGLLARARPGFSVGIVVVHTRGATTCIIDGRANDNIEDGDYTPVIAAGDYTVFATIVCGEQVHKITRNFKVGTAQHPTCWV